jgi:GNAT superfamily N-acetyltransferase
LSRGPDLRLGETPLAAQIVPEAALSPADRAELRAFLVAAYAPRFADVFSRHDFWGGPAEARLILRGTDGTIAAHCGFGLRTIGVGGEDVRVAGIGAVATAPALRGRGLGREMFAVLFAHLEQAGAADFAFLECSDPVVGFYARCGFAHSLATVTAIEPATGALDASTSNVMTRPTGGARVPGGWPEGPIDLRGMRW